ncbi:hypothetical protein [Sphingomonas oligophenolica]|uniref:Uncharacterized protein n=1 Tax=Sphingomonas oligophenolica TaxID=301154 RepID=A0A502CJQ9_9SPHN|nr:hypothetical protein [Sphingomonas oligophenolica]TPG13053.1 hypothetical protein EAH84_06445 [Sphingomonas oligophenolica]
MTRSLTLTLLAAATLSACTQTPAESARAIQDAAATQLALDKELAGLVPTGNRLTCLPPLPSAHVEGYGSTLVYSVSSRQKYRTETGGGCEGVGRGDILVTTSNGGRTCQGDISQTIDRTSRFPTGSCAFGPFVEYRRP